MCLEWRLYILIEEVRYCIEGVKDIFFASGTVMGISANPSSQLSRATDVLNLCLFRERPSHSLSSQLGGRKRLDSQGYRF